LPSRLVFFPVGEPAASPHISFENVEVKYSDIVYGLRGVSLRVNRGEFVFLTGPSGAGKSTLLKLLTKEVDPTSGRVILAGRNISNLRPRFIPAVRRQMGIVPQDFALLPRKRVFENVAYAMRAVGHSKREARDRVPEILEMVHIGHRADAFPHELSGGEQQRVAIGRALVNDPPLLLADEPTGNLDPEHSWEIMELLLELNRNGTTVVVASHDMMVVNRMTERVVTLENGLISGEYRNSPEPALKPPSISSAEALVTVPDRGPEVGEEVDV
jgi:cell division transport system ATP-binding protein